MRTLFLSSSGFRDTTTRDEFLKILRKPVDQIKMAYVTTAVKEASVNDYERRDRAAIDDLGVNYVEVDLSEKTIDELRQIFADIDVLYMQGGNTYYLLSEVYRSGFDVVLYELLDRGVVYFGTSAGSYIMCPTVEMYEWKDTRENRYGLTSMKALGLVPFLISAHYDPEKYKEKVLEGVSKTDLQVRVLMNGQALLVRGDQVTFVGSGEEHVF